MSINKHSIHSPKIRVPTNECYFSFARSGGPGGQNVNKVNSKAVLHWPVSKSPSLSKAVKDRFLKRYQNQITTEGDLLLTSQKYRDQNRNIDECFEKLHKMILSVAIPPKLRKPTQPTQASKLRHGEKKRTHSLKKQYRRPPSLDD
jgi:ribosome-associated protein